jgi:hypothetical protein
MSNELRRYGPGKFNLLIDAYVYELSLDSSDDEAGDVDSGLHYALLRGPFETITQEHPELTTAELVLLTRTSGVIVITDSQGFVTVNYYDTSTELESDWLRCVRDAESRYNDSEHDE